MDLENVCENKKNILKVLEEKIPENLKIISGNALRKADYEKCIDEHIEQVLNNAIVVVMQIKRR